MHLAVVRFPPSTEENSPPQTLPAVRVASTTARRMTTTKRIKRQKAETSPRQSFTSCVDNHRQTAREIDWTRQKDGGLIDPAV